MACKGLVWNKALYIVAGNTAVCNSLFYPNKKSADGEEPSALGVGEEKGQVANPQLFGGDYKTE